MTAVFVILYLVLGALAIAWAARSSDRGLLLVGALWPVTLIVAVLRTGHLLVRERKAQHLLVKKQKDW